ncbi:MAG: 4'-phosphopantetheinyl transferase family protein [Myxococcales bacterium]
MSLLPRDFERGWSWAGTAVALHRLRDAVADEELSAGELALARAARSERRRQELRAGRAAAHAALRAAGRRRRSEVLCSEEGLPRLIDARGWRVSICHAGDWAAATSARAPVGIDLEPLSRLRQVARVVEGWGGGPIADPDLPLPLPLLRWTAWEALGKLSGRGVLAGAKRPIRPRLTAAGLIAQSEGARLRWWTFDAHLLCLAVRR